MSSMNQSKWYKPSIAVLAVYLTTSIHHIYGAWLYETPWRTHIAVQGLPFLGASLLFIFLYQWTKKSVFYWLLIFVSGFFFVGAIGLYEGGYNHVLKNILYFAGMDSNTLLILYPPPKYELPDDFLFEASGIYTFYISMYCAKQLYKYGSEKFNFRIRRAHIIYFLVFLSSLAVLWWASKNPFGVVFGLSVLLFTGTTSLLLYSTVAKSANRLLKAIVIMLILGITSLGVVASFYPSTFTPSRKLSIKQWIQDIDQLTTLLKTKHIQFENVYPGSIDEDVKILKENISSLTNEAIQLELMKMVAKMEVSHSQINPFQRAIRTNLLPIKTQYFIDGVFITEASKDYKNLVGGRILEVENTGWKDVVAILRKYIAAEEPQHEKVFIPYYLANEYLLRHEGIVTKKFTKLTIEKDGQVFEVKIKTVSQLQFMIWALRTQPDEEIKQPVSFQFNPDPYSFEVLQGKYLYMQFNESRNKDESFTNFCYRLEKLIQSKPIDRFILDLRNHTGGNLHANTPLINLLYDHFPKYGNLYVLTSEKTASAAIVLLNDIRLRMEPIVVGTPVANGPNMFSNPITYTLSNSRIEVELSSFNHHTQMRDWVIPYGEELPLDHYLPYSAIDFFEGYDDQLVFAINHSIPGQVSHTKVIRDTTLLLGNYQVATISKSEKTLDLHIGDFSHSGWFDSLSLSNEILPHIVDKDLFALDGNKYFSRDSLVYLNSINDTLYLHYFDNSWPLVPIPKGYQFPVKQIAAGEVESAIKSLENFPERIPKSLEYKINNLGYYYLNQGKASLAIRYFEFNLKAFPNSANANDSYAEALLISGDKEGARRYYQVAYEIQPSSRVKKILDEL